MEIFRYDLASLSEPQIILITETTGKRSECPRPRLGYAVLPNPSRRAATQRPSPCSLAVERRESVDAVFQGRTGFRGIRL